MKREDTRTELQQRVAAELREKLHGSEPLTYEKPLNSVVEGTHQSKDLGAIIILIIAVMVVGTIYFFMAR